MRNFILGFLISLVLVICTYFATIYNLRIDRIRITEQGELITINGQDYFYEF